MEISFLSNFGEFTEEEAAQIRELVDATYLKFKDVNDLEFITESTVLAQELPLRLRQYASKCIVEEKGVVLIPCLSVYGLLTDVTPADWTQVENTEQSVKHEIMVCLIASLFSHIFGWQTQQNGKYKHNVLPMKQHENSQIGFSSKEELSWHTEDAFHKDRSDYLALYCVKNSQNVPTTFASSFDLMLTQEHKQILRNKHFSILPDNSHKAELNTIATSHFDGIEKMLEDPDAIAILYGDETRPYMRIDPDYCQLTTSDKDVVDAYEEIKAQINKNLIDISLQPGELCIVHNEQMVHGRRSFDASYDGQDRWLKRLNLKKNLNTAQGSFTKNTRLIN
ncbi:TauD/TfdA family dioxygenase [Thalassomonas haliotis]|uniref:TauD/TfdA family dioxygenase n=1 Tax=Thalassomonas haliotis TaxID=485448 RepID=A0ABY7VDN4_9GAMM|nr:TauD/TfdA family dioxygenase [Thalassomonas haliotis]WDE11824.1 TauD/TfdA family dioxygenase [Thalassomonas haliotis]